MAELSTLGSVIKTAYEAEADTNAYTDAEKSKLAAIEAAADVTDTANVTAAGALMDSEVTNLAAVKAFDPTAYATAAQGATADSALQDVVSDTTPQLGGSLDVNGNKIVSASNGNIDIEPNGTGNVLLGNFTFDADQTVGAGQDNYVLTYDNGTGLISLEAASGGGSGDFLANGTVDMTGEFRTDVGTFDSDVADGASAVAFSYDTAAAYSTAGAKLARWKNNNTEVFSIDKDGYVVLPTDAEFRVYNGPELLLSIEGNGSGDLSIGRSASATSNDAVAIGELATATVAGVAVGAGTAAPSSGVSIGNDAESLKTGAITFAGGSFHGARGLHYSGLTIGAHRFAATGDHQFLLWQPANTTTDNTPTLLWLDEATASERMSVGSGKMYAFQAHIVGVQSDGTDACYYVRRGIIANNSGTTALIGSIQTDGTDIESNAACDVALTANNTNDCLDITVTGIAAETWRWGANVFVKDITIGT